MSDIHIPTLQQFITLGRGGFSRADRFVVNFYRPRVLEKNPNYGDLRDISMLCEEAAFPGKTIGTRTLRVNALNEQRAHTVDFMGDTITFQFICDIDWRVRKFFEDWMHGCVGDETQQFISREVGFYDDYKSKVSITALVPRYDGPVASSPASILDKIKGRTPRVPNENQSPETATFQMDLYEAWPRNMNVQQLSYNNQTFHRLNVAFTYKYYQTSFITIPDGDRKFVPLASIDPLTQAINTAREQITGAGKGLSGLLRTRTAVIPKKPF
jgi:hypothetical protein